MVGARKKKGSSTPVKQRLKRIILNRASSYVTGTTREAASAAMLLPPCPTFKPRRISGAAGDLQHRVEGSRTRPRYHAVELGNGCLRGQRWHSDIKPRSRQHSARSPPRRRAWRKQPRTSSRPS